MKNPLKTLTNEAPGFLSRFDSSTDMTLGLSSFHHGEVFKKVATGGEAYSKIINALPESWRKKLYSYGGMIDATTYKDISAIDAEEISQWVCQLYPDQVYPAIAIGSSNGALSHLYAAMGIPWLGQSFLVPISKGEKQPVDKPEDTIRWSEKQGAVFLKNNPGWHLSQMMDPVQDRIRSGLIAYFRIKKQRLGKWYMKFIKERMQPGGTIYVADCDLQWPVISIGKNHTFQFGGLGTFTPGEFYHGSERITTFLKEVKAPVDHWQVPAPDAKAPEAEWGFDETLMDDILQLAKKEGYKVTRITYSHPQDVSPNVANMYRQWYRQHNQISDRLLAESFTVHSPLLALQTSAVPYWLFFNSTEAAGMMEKYLDETEPFREMYMMILSHGKSLGGVTSIEHWQRILSRATDKGQFVGMDPKEYPVDFGVFTRYTKALEKAIEDRYPVQKIPIEDFNSKYSEFFNTGSVGLKSI